MTTRHSGAEGWESEGPFVSTNQLIINTLLYVYVLLFLSGDVWPRRAADWG